MFHKVVIVFMLGLHGGDNKMDLQFVDGPPNDTPAACWLKFNEDHYGTIIYAECVNEDRILVYRGRVAEMVNT